MCIRDRRKTGRQYSILTVEKPDFDAFAVADGDSVSVGRIFNEYANRLVITGAVWRPGNYELTDNTATLDVYKRQSTLRVRSFP